MKEKDEHKIFLIEDYRKKRVMLDQKKRIKIKEGTMNSKQLRNEEEKIRVQESYHIPSNYSKVKHECQSLHN